MQGKLDGFQKQFKDQLLKSDELESKVKGASQSEIAILKESLQQDHQNDMRV